MKRLFFLSGIIVTSFLSYSQQPLITDDGLVTRSLSVNTNKDYIVNFLKDFNTGLASARSKSFSDEEMTTFLGFDPKTISLERLYDQAPVDCRNCPISRQVIQKLIEIKSNIGTVYIKMNDVRQALKRVALSTKLSSTESDFIAMIDLTLQGIDQNYGLTAKNKKLQKAKPSSYEIAVYILSGYHAPPGTTAGTSAVIGGIVGGRSGIPLGITIGGIVGSIGETFTQATN